MTQATTDSTASDDKRETIVQGWLDENLSSDEATASAQSEGSHAATGSIKPPLEPDQPAAAEQAPAPAAQHDVVISTEQESGSSHAAAAIPFEAHQEVPEPDLAAVAAAHVPSVTVPEEAAAPNLQKDAGVHTVLQHSGEVQAV